MPSEVEAQNLRAVSHALLSVYYQTVGRLFEVRGAPSVLLPAEVQPMTLSEALAVLAEKAPARLREALWRIVRSVPAIRLPSTEDSFGFGGAQGYPAAMLPYLNGAPLQALIGLRRDYRRYANLFSAALIACRDGEPEVFEHLLDLLQDRQEGFPLAISRVLGDALLPHLGEVTQAKHAESWKGLSGQIARIESDVGCSVQEFVEGIADAAAFDEVMASDEMQRAIPALRRPEDAPLAVYPLCTVIKQNTQSLVTSATSTAIVRGEFEDIKTAIDPANWERAGSIVKRARFVRDPFTPITEVDPPHFGGGQPAVLHEQAEISWNGRSDQYAQFKNMLNVVSSVWEPDDANGSGNSDQPEVRTAEVRYNLCRSIDSVVLWDQRAGGLLVNQGFIKVRPVGGDRWQVTLRKELQFSDRTPATNSRGWKDFGQLASYLAPATLTWWLECETYRLGADPDAELRQSAHWIRPQPRPISPAPSG